MEKMLGEIGIVLAEKQISAFVKFVRTKHSQQEAMEHLHEELSDIFRRLEGLVFHNKMTEYFSEGQFRGIYERFTVTNSEEDIITKKQREIMDSLNPPLNEVSQISSAVKEICELLFRYANPISQESRALENRIIQATARSIKKSEHHITKAVSQTTQTPPRKMQVLTIEQFISTKDATTINASLERILYHRNKELEEAIQELELNKALVLSGFAGVGKTRLALEIVVCIAKSENREIICIHSHGAELYQELQSTLKNHGRYIFLVDDANEFTELSHILAYLAPNDGQIDAKAVFTVRNYALTKVILSIRNAVSVEQMTLEPMARQEIVELIQGEYPNFFSIVVEQIAHIAKGNARLALMGAQCVQKEQSLAKVHNATELYDHYYKIVLNSNPIWNDPTNICTAAIIAMVNVIDMERMEKILPLLDSCNLSQQTMQESVRILHEAEIVDLCLNRAAKMPDQCLGDYLIKKVLLDEQWISLNNFIETCFDYHRQALIRTISMLLNVFHEESIVQELITVIKSIWKKWEEASDPRFWSFVMAFHWADPLRTFAMLKSYIDNEPFEEYEVRQINFEKGKNHQSYTDDLLTILSEYCYEYTEIAIRLILRYYDKRPSLYMQVYHCLCKMAIPNEKAYHAGFLIQNNLANEMLKHVQAQADDATILLSGRIALHMLGLIFTDAYSADTKSVIFATIPMRETESSRCYRNKLWDIINVIISDATLKQEIISFLGSYAGTHERLNRDVIQGDFHSIRQLIIDNFKPDCLLHTISLEMLVRHLTKYIPSEQMEFTDVYFKTKAYAMAQILLTEEYDADYHVRKQKKRTQLLTFATELKTDEIPLLLSTAIELRKINTVDAWKVQSSFACILHAMDDRPAMQLTLIEEYLQTGASLGISFTTSFQNLMNYYTVKNLWERINAFVPYAYETAVFEFLSLIPPEQITHEYVLALKTYFDNHPILTSSPYRDLKFLMHYLDKDSQIITYVLNSLVEKGKQSPYLLIIYGHWAFHDDLWLLEICKDEIDLLYKFYIAVIKADINVDYEGKNFIALLQTKPEILSCFLKEFINSDVDSNNASEKLSILMNEDRYLMFFDQVMQEIIKSESIFIPRKGELLSEILHGFNAQCNIDRINECLRSMITYCQGDLERIEVLFWVLDKLPQECRRYAIVEWLKTHPNQEQLGKVSLGRRMFIWEGSAIPIYQQEIQFFEGILSNLDDIDDLDSAARVQQEIDDLRKAIRGKTLNEFLTDR